MDLFKISDDELISMAIVDEIDRRRAEERRKYQPRRSPIDTIGSIAIGMQLQQNLDRMFKK